MNGLQKKQFEILEEFIRICSRLNINYYLVCGSALGAEKYGGFIPWDDDIDVGLLREDYEIFVREAQKYLPAKYFVQNYRTDSRFPRVYTKLRDSETTYIEKPVKNLDINHGIYIDVFPLDGYPQGKLQAMFFELKKKVYQNILYAAMDIERKGKSALIYPVSRMMLKTAGSAAVADRYSRMISSWPVNGSALICNHGNWQGRLEYAPREQYGKGKVSVFEGLKVTVPEKSDDYLRQKYGDYMTELPESEKKGHHYYEICDCSKPYTSYVKGKKYEKND